jgi:glycosyltransferase involved in cell wall biosynthesis
VNRATRAVPRRYDVILFDSVGMPYTGSTPEHGGIGGSELEFILLGEALVRRGYSVLVLNNTLLPAHEGGVEYASHRAVVQHRFECRALVVAGRSPIPPISFQKVVVAVSDAPGDGPDPLAALFSSAEDATLVAVSNWQRSLFPAAWKAVVIPYMLPERVYSRGGPSADEGGARSRRRFVYASAARKGIVETFAAWQELKADPSVADAELVVCMPGHDAVDEATLARAGVGFLGSLPFDRVVAEIASSAGLFYVNRAPETFCLVAALTEALGRRVHVLCTRGEGALRETVASPLVTSDRAQFFEQFRAAYASPDDPRWTATPKDYHEATVAAEWVRVLGLAWTRPSNVIAPAGVEPTVCLNMIVKNEAHVIERCLASVRAIISYWVIVDTGSTDGTQDVIRKLMEGVPGELHERPWKDFGTNRTEAIELATGKADYLLVLDADDLLEVKEGFSRRELTLDSYELRIEDHGAVYFRSQVFRADGGFRYVGVIHEGLVPVGRRRSQGRLETLVYRRLGGGARALDPERSNRDIAVLEQALREDPENPRHTFFLAETLRVAGRSEEAVSVYERRVALGAWAEEVSASLFAIAQLSEKLGKSDDAVIAAYLRAYEFRPQRAEALCHLAVFCRLKNRMALAHLYATAAKAIPRPDDILAVHEAVYAWRSLDEYAISAYYIGRHAEAIDANRRLLASPHLPEGERARVQKNLEFSTAIVGDK